MNQTVRDISKGSTPCPLVSHASNIFSLRSASSKFQVIPVIPEEVTRREWILRMQDCRKFLFFRSFYLYVLIDSRDHSSVRGGDQSIESLTDKTARRATVASQFKQM